MADFCIRKGDRLPEIRSTLTDSTGAAVDVTGLTVKFHMRAVNSTTAKVDAAATPVTPATGIVKYAWVAADTDTAGSYWAEWEVTFGDGRKQTFPNPNLLSVSIAEELA